MKTGRVLIIACGALARELGDVLKGARFDWVDIECLPAVLHNTPQLITDAVRERLDRASGRYESVFVGYADCGTGGTLDRLLDERGIERLPGAHCYEFFAGADRFARLHEEDPATFYLTDFLVKHFDRLVWHGLGLDRWPELRDDYFGNYRRVIYLSQIPSDDLLQKAKGAAQKLGLAFEHHHVGYGDFEPAIAAAAGSVA